MYHCTPFRNGIPSVSYSKRHNEISDVVNYNPNILGRPAQGLTAKRVLLNFISGHWQVCRIFEKHGLVFTNQKKKREGCFMVRPENCDIKLPVYLKIGQTVGKIKSDI